MRKKLEQMEFDFMKEEHRARKLAYLKENGLGVSGMIVVMAATVYGFEKIIVPLLNTGVEYLGKLSQATQNYQGF